jgi:plastocyanin
MMTLRNPLSRVFTLLVVAVALCLPPAPYAWAGGVTVRGTVKMPDASRSTRLYSGYWRLENGNVPVKTEGGAKAETVVVLENVNGAKSPSARTITITLGGLDARPRLVVAGPGSVIEFKNTGAVRHELSTPDTPDVMHLETLQPGGQPRRQRFDKVGTYVVKDSEYPHIMISVLILGTQYFSAVDEKGAFSIANVPEGPCNLKVWARGKWVTDQQIDTSTLGKEELTIKVASQREQLKAEQEAKANE